MEILFFEPTFKDYLWGGNKLENVLNKKTPFETTAESWEISANKNGKSVIKNGKYKGLDLEELFNIKEIREDVFGKKCKSMDKFPLLIKFIDAKKELSVQVHPNDEYAQANENSYGKTEFWYIMDCDKESQIVYGMDNKLSKNELKQIIEDGKIKDCLNYKKVEKGDSIFIAPGTVHAIMKNILICEIQQNSDLTYRVYDWDRVDKNGKSRELHIDKALDVIDLSNETNVIKSQNVEIQNLVDCEYFKIDKVVVNEKFIGKVNKDSFVAVNVVDGNGYIKVDSYSYEIKKGDSFLIPAVIDSYEISGNLKMLRSFI